MRAHLVTSALALTLVCLGLAGCNRPTEDECRKAVINIQKIQKIEHSSNAPDPEAAVRTCRGRSSRKAVLCTIEAKTEQDLKVCEERQK